jgi:hypothetical protein
MGRKSKSSATASNGFRIQFIRLMETLAFPAAIVVVATAAAIAVVVVVKGMLPFSTNISYFLIEINLLWIIMFLYTHIHIYTYICYNIHLCIYSLIIHCMYCGCLEGTDLSMHWVFQLHLRS